MIRGLRIMFGSVGIVERKTIRMRKVMKKAMLSQPMASNL